MIKVTGGLFEFNGIEQQISDFSIGKYPVTQKQWREIMGNNPSHFKGDDLPVESVSWDDIQEFLEKLNVKNPGKNYRLPTEAEWEYAARGGARAPEQYKYAGSNNIESVAWYNDNAGGKTHPVGRKNPNALGLYDMSGNVWELCINKKTANSFSSYVLRGGSWYVNSYICRSAYRSRVDPGSGVSSVGFRLVHE